jgi:hypothetical protein
MAGSHSRHGKFNPLDTAGMRASFLTLFAVIVACDSQRTCTSELRSALTVQISSPQGLEVDSVTATRRVELPCENSSVEHAGARDAAAGSNELVYTCWENGGGTYVVRVKSGQSTWTQKVHVNADFCHTTEHKTLSFVLDPETAD